MTIKRLSLAPGASITANLVAVTGILDEWRSPFPTPAAEITPDDGSLFTVAVDGTMLTVTGVAEGSGMITLINPDVSPALRTEIVVTVQAEAPGVRWELDAPVQTTYVPPLEVDVLVNDARVQLTFTGTGADDPKDIDWGDGTVWSQRDDNPAQYDYSANNLYTINVNNGEWTTEVLIDHFPAMNVDVSSDPVVVASHDKGEIFTTVNWGDGTAEDEGLADTFNHQYQENGEYTITMTIGGFDPITETATIQNVDVGGASVPPNDTICYGPFQAGSVKFWVCMAASEPRWFSVAFDVDSDPEPDIQVSGPVLASALQNAEPEVRQAILAKVVELKRG